MRSTNPRQRQLPRLTYDQLEDFLRNLRDKDGEGRRPIISSRPEWIAKVEQATHEGQRYLAEVPRPEHDDFLPGEVTERAIEHLRPLLSEFSLFGLAAGDCQLNKDLDGFVRSAAISSGEHALFLMPFFEREANAPTLFDTLDPFQCLSRLSAEPGLWPGMMFWSRSGATTVAPLDGVGDLYRELESPLKRDDIAKIDDILNAYKPKVSSKKILHLSDLHFGSSETTRNNPLLQAKLRSVVPTVDSVVITGDIFDSPKEENASEYQVFKNSIESLTRSGKESIVIPGNHDERWMGNSLGPLGENLRHLSNFQSRKALVDDELNCVFFCFDSAAGGSWATGKVSDAEKLTIGTEFENKCARRPDLRKYWTIALVHHHPFQFDTANYTFVDTVLSWFHWKEATQKMHDADKFVDWCAHRGVSAILHGHKHVAHNAVKTISYQHPDRYFEQEIRAIGCGSSLGKDDGPVAYDVIALDDRSRNWGVTFFSDRGDGSGFVEGNVSLTHVKDVPVKPSLFDRIKRRVFG
jgi:3',5'-cyclic AMP phosphodiesterase CpdA